MSKKKYIKVKKVIAIDSPPNAESCKKVLYGMTRIIGNFTSAEGAPYYR